MGSLLRPVGPEPVATYWRRRGAVAGAVVLSLVLLWMLASTAFGSSAQQSEGSDGADGLYTAPPPATLPAQEGPVPDPDAPMTTQEPTQGSTPTASTTPTPAASTSPSPSATQAVAMCRPSDVTVSIEAEDSATKVGAGMAFSVKVTNTSKTTCRRDVGSASSAVEVTSGPAMVWSSRFCAKELTKDVVSIKAGKAWTGKITWPGKVTARTCPDTQPTAAPGTYRAVVENATITSAPVRFVVR